jgi:hypothetical protein
MFVQVWPGNLLIAEPPSMHPAGHFVENASGEEALPVEAR